MTGGTHRLDYRGDIDGLRAIAVLGVVVYHAFPAAAQSGFTGVDVFFVISGFLITQIIARDLGAGRFSFGEFYARRIRRIFPALMIVLIATYAIGWHTLFSNEFAQLGKHVLAGAAFVSNFALWQEAGYFDAPSHAKPLLHLWSLGVEEQFYVFWPLFLVLTWRIARRLDIALLALALVSFIACVIDTRVDVDTAFYVPVFRFWELAIGGLVAVIGTRLDSVTARARLPIGFAGLALIVAGMVSITNRAGYPGWLALMPTVGAVLVIVAGPQGPINRLLGSRLLVGIGLISYPLYLWHWPLLTFARIVDGPLPSRSVRGSLVILSFALACATYWFVERPIRKGIGVRRIAVGLAAAMAMVAAVGGATVLRGGLPQRPVAAAAEPLIASSARSPRIGECFNHPDAQGGPDDWYCHLNAAGAPATTFVVGDSHAFAMIPAFEQIARARNEDILFASFAGCPPLLGVTSMRADQSVRNCRNLNERVFELVTARRLARVLLVANWTYYTDGDYTGTGFNMIQYGETSPTREGSREAFGRGLEETLSRYGAAGVPLHFVQRVPAQLRNSTDLIRDVGMKARGDREAAVRAVSVPRTTNWMSLQFVNGVFAARGVRPRDGRAELIDLTDVYCRPDVCPFAAGDESFYFDGNHLSARGALLAVPALTAAFDQRPSARIP